MGGLRSLRGMMLMRRMKRRRVGAADGESELHSLPPQTQSSSFHSSSCFCRCANLSVCFRGESNFISRTPPLNCLVLCLPRRACALGVGCGWERCHLAYQ